jgi:ribosomal protein S18 acetylase RimI-like enzyme
MTIRDAHPTDARALWRLNEQFNGAGTHEYASLRSALEMGGSELVTVAEKDGHLVGFICGQVTISFCYPAPCAGITELYVEAAHRRHGVAGALVREMERSFRARGASEIRLLTGAKNHTAQAFYEKMGYAMANGVEYCKQSIERE